MIKDLIQNVLREYPRLSKESKFKFSCHKGLSCFTKCCGDVNIFLTPYDVLRMKKALGLSSGEFLEKYTVSPFWDKQELPLVLLRMQDNERKSCPFVTTEGCSIYQDRPWSCRMFPLGIASTKTADRPDGLDLCFMVEDGSSCQGFKEDREWTVAEWWKNQGIDLYDKKCEPYKELTLHERFRQGKLLGPAKAQMFYITCYDLDRFRRLILNSSFFGRFEVADDVIERIKTDDEALLNFGYDWLRFSLFGEDTLKVRAEVLEEQKKVLFKSK